MILYITDVWNTKTDYTNENEKKIFKKLCDIKDNIWYNNRFFIAGYFYQDMEISLNFD